MLILHFYLSSKFVSTYKIHQMSVPLQIHTNPHYKTFSEANLPFQGLRGSINEVRHFSNQTNLLKPLKLFKNTNKTEFYFVSGSLESASTRLQPSYGSFQLGNEVKTKKQKNANKSRVRWAVVPCRDSAIKSLGINKILFVKHCNINNTICLTL